MNEQMQALCFLAGANSIFYGEKLLTTPLPEESSDLALFKKLGINAEKTHLDNSPTEPQTRFYDASKQAAPAIA